MRSSASRATATSSNGSTWLPITWYFSCPLPATSTRSPGPRQLDRPGDRLAAIDDREQPLLAVAAGVGGDAALDLLDDPAGILAARIVRRDHDHVAQPAGDRAHQRALRAIAIAAAAEHRDQPPARQRPRRLEQVAQRVVGVRVVDDDGDLVAWRPKRPGTGPARRRAPRRRARSHRTTGRAPWRSRPPRGCCRRSAGRPAAT